MMAGKTKKTRPARPSTLGLHLTLLRARARMTLDQDGATAIEYALIASGIGAAVAVTVFSLGATTASFY